MERREEPAFQVTRILLPTDYSPGAEAAMAWAKGLSRLLSAEVTIMHVIEPRQWMPEPHQESQAQLDRLASDFPRARTLIVDGSPGEMIVKIGDTEADLVVMGTHGRSGFKRMFMGSVAEYVVRNCVKPVLTIRMEDKTAKVA
jgi:nucleotide-binding universal stress UspA family protein